MNEHLLRGQLLYQQDRLAQAETELRLAVVEEPEAAEVRVVLAGCLADQGKLDEAEHEAERAIALGPNRPYAHVALAQVLHRRGRTAQAERVAAEALRLDPTDPNVHSVLAGVRYDRGNWSGALRAADDGLAYDPHHARCATLRTMALTQLGRTEDAVEAAAAALRHDPANANAHAAQGWALLHQSDPKAALIHFREALRLEPGSPYARAGMIEALKARYWVYRQALRFFLWMGRLSPRARWGVALGLILLQMGLAEVAVRAPVLAPLARPLHLAIFGFLVFTLLANPLFNLALRLNRYGRHALSPDQRMQSHAVAALVLVGLSSVAVWVAGYYPSDVFGQATAFTCLWLLVPVSSIFQVPTGWPRWVLIAYCGVMGLIFGVMNWWFVKALADFDRGWVEAGRTAARTAWDLLDLNMWAGLAASFLSSWLATQRRR